MSKAKRKYETKANLSSDTVASMFQVLSTPPAQRIPGDHVDDHGHLRVARCTHCGDPANRRRHVDRELIDTLDFLESDAARFWARFTLDFNDYVDGEWCDWCIAQLHAADEQYQHLRERETH